MKAPVRWGRFAPKPRRARQIAIRSQVTDRKPYGERYEREGVADYKRGPLFLPGAARRIRGPPTTVRPCHRTAEQKRCTLSAPRGAQLAAARRSLHRRVRRKPVRRGRGE